MSLKIAGISDCAPCNGESRQTLGTQPAGDSFDIGIGSHIVELPGIAEQGSGRREKEEVVERQLAGDTF
jgi:hypothetical protein